MNTNETTNTNVNVTNVTCKTKLDRNSVNRVVTRLELDWTGVEVDQLRELATKSVIIALQAEWRPAGEIPKEASVAVAELLNRGRKPRATMAPAAAAAKAVEKLSDAELEALEARIAAIRAGR